MQKSRPNSLFLSSALSLLADSDYSPTNPYIFRNFTTGEDIGAPRIRRKITPKRITTDYAPVEQEEVLSKKKLKKIRNRKS